MLYTPAMARKGALFSLILTTLTLNAQVGYLYEFKGEFDEFSHVSQVLTQVEKAGNLLFETPQKMSIQVSCLDSTCPKKFKAQFCLDQTLWSLAPVCNASGTHFFLKSKQEVKQNNFTARILGSLCVSQKENDETIVPHPQVSFVVRDDKNKQLFQPFTIEPKQFEKRTPLKALNMPVCENKLEILK